MPCREWSVSADDPSPRNCDTELERAQHGRGTPAGRARADGIVIGVDRIAVRRDMITSHRRLTSL